MSRRGKRRRAARGRDEDPTVFPGHDARNPRYEDAYGDPPADPYQDRLADGRDFGGDAGAHDAAWDPAAGQPPWPPEPGSYPTGWEEHTAAWEGHPADWTGDGWRAGGHEPPGTDAYQDAPTGTAGPGSGHDPRAGYGDEYPEEYQDEYGAARTRAFPWDDGSRAGGWVAPEDGGPAGRADAGQDPLAPTYHDDPDAGPDEATQAFHDAGSPLERTGRRGRRRSRRGRRDPEPEEGYGNDVDEHDQAAAADEPTSRGELRPDPPPMETNEVLVLTIGTVLWGLAFAVLLPLHGRLAEAGKGWWVWTCVAGVGIGLLGIYYARRHREKSDRGEQSGDVLEEATPEAPPVPPAPGFHVPGHAGTAHEDAGYEDRAVGDAGEPTQAFSPPEPESPHQPGFGPQAFGGFDPGGFDPDAPQSPPFGVHGAPATPPYGSPDLPPPPQAPWLAGGPGVSGGWPADHAPWDQTGQHGPL